MSHIMPYSKNWGWSLNHSHRSKIEPKEKEPEITLNDLEGRYAAFCVYVKEPYFKGSVFKMWGMGRVGSTFTKK